MKKLLLIIALFGYCVSANAAATIAFEHNLYCSETVTTRVSDSVVILPTLRDQDIFSHIANKRLQEKPTDYLVFQEVNEKILPAKFVSTNPVVCLTAASSVNINTELNAFIFGPIRYTISVNF